MQILLSLHLLCLSLCIEDLFKFRPLQFDQLFLSDRANMTNLFSCRYVHHIYLYVSKTLSKFKTLQFN